jgi:effector-binding domain-containing protein
MATEVSVQLVSARRLAAVRQSIRLDQIATAWWRALDQVWAFLQQHPGLRTDGHNIFLYHHPANIQSPMDVDFGVQVTRLFERSGDVVSTETPAGRVATALHVGPYERRFMPGPPPTKRRFPARSGRFTATRRKMPRNWKRGSNISCPREYLLF